MSKRGRMKATTQEQLSRQLLQRAANALQESAGRGDNNPLAMEIYDFLRETEPRCKQLLDIMLNTLPITEATEIAEWHNGGAETMPEVEEIREVLREAGLIE